MFIYGYISDFCIGHVNEKDIPKKKLWFAFLTRSDSSMTPI